MLPGRHHLGGGAGSEGMMEHEAFQWFSMVPEDWRPIAVGLLVVGLLFAFTARVAARLADVDAAVVPDEGVSARSVAEAFVEAMVALAKSAIPDHTERYVPLLAAFFAFILTANLLGLVPGFVPATSSFNVTFALGLVSFVAYHAYGVRAQGGGSYLKHFLGPIWWLGPLMLLIEMFSHAFRPVSLGIRLYANMFADHTVVEIFTELTWYVVPVAFLLLGTFVALVQAFVFTMLSAIYISGAVSHAHGHDDL
jgi:F-type H+-transporting ATPase subunit a